MFTRGRYRWVVLMTLAAVLVFAAAAKAQDAGAKAADDGKSSPYAGMKVSDLTSGKGGSTDNEIQRSSGWAEGLETLMRMLLWLGVFVVLIYVAVWLIRKYMPSARGMLGAGALRVVSRSYVSAKQSILLVKVGERFVVVGVTPASMTPLTEITDAEEARRLTEELAAGQEGAHSKSFRAELRRADDETAKTVGTSDGARDAEVREVSREIDAVREKINDWRGKTQA